MPEESVHVAFDGTTLAYQLVEGLRWRISSDHVEREWDPTKVGEDLMQAQRDGPVWGIQRHLQGRLALHASATLFDGEALLVAAPSGTGKSTTATELRRRGGAFLADDVSSIRKGPIVEAGPPHVRLWPDAMLWAGIPEDGTRRLIEGVDKRVALMEPAQAQAPLKAVAVLERGPGAVEPLTGKDAFMALVAQTYAFQGPRLRGVLKPTKEHFALCDEVVRTTPVLRWSVPEGHAHIPAAVDRLLEVL